VTLSACETGINKIESGDEIVGLLRAIIYSGARSVVVSLWPVSSIVTEGIMIEFYTNIRNGDDKASALQKAQIKVRDEFKEKYGELAAHPFFWASFILVGDWK
jgi:CHAT domain-containing protein